MKLLSPRSPRKPAPHEVSNEDLIILKNQLSKLLGEAPSKEDIVLLGSKVEEYPPLSLLALDRICFELERRGYAHGLFRVSGSQLQAKALLVALTHLKHGEEVVFKVEPNIHNIASALVMGLSGTVDLLHVGQYASLFECLGKGHHVVEQAMNLARAVDALPSKLYWQRLAKLCADIARQSDANKMTPQNLAIVFAPVLFHDAAESLGALAASQQLKVATLELMFSQYPLVFPLPLEPLYKPPAKPGEAHLLGQRDWAVLESKASAPIVLAKGDKLVERGKAMTNIYRVRQGSMEIGTRLVLPGDFFGERALLGKPKAEANYVAAGDEETVLVPISNHSLELLLSVDAQLATAYWGHLALVCASELRSFVSVSEERLARSRILRFSTVLQEEAAEHADDKDDMRNLNLPIGSAAASSAKGGDGKALIVRDGFLDKKEVHVTVDPLEIRLEFSKNILGTLAKKTVRIPFEALERLSTSVPDDVICGRKHASKVYSRKPPFSTITLVVRKRGRRSFKITSKTLSFFTEADAAEVFACVGRIFQTVSEELLADPAKKFSLSLAEDSAPSGAVSIVSKAVALVDFQDPTPGGTFSFKTGDIVYLTTDKHDLRVKGKREDSSQFGLFPRDYVEPVVWTTGVKNTPLDADWAPLLATAVVHELAADQVIVSEGELLDGIYFIRSGICRAFSRKRSITSYGKMAKGDFFGEISFLVGGAASCSVAAHTAATVLEIRRDVLRATFSVRPDLAAKFFRLFAAVNLRRIERNRALPYQERKRQSAMFSTVTKVPEGET